MAGISSKCFVIMIVQHSPSYSKKLPQLIGFSWSKHLLDFPKSNPNLCFSLILVSKNFWPRPYPLPPPRLVQTWAHGKAGGWPSTEISSCNNCSYHSLCSRQWTIATHPVWKLSISQPSLIILKSLNPSTPCKMLLKY